MAGIDWIIIALLALGTFSCVYLLGNKLLPSGRGLRRLRRYSPPVEVIINYRNESGTKSSQRVAVLRTLHHRDGRLYLFGLCGSKRNPRTFRVERIACVTTIDGEAIEKRQFLESWLGIPSTLFAGTL